MSVHHDPHNWDRRSIGERHLWERRMTMGQIGATSKRGVNRQAFSPEAGRAQQLLVTWGWEVSFTVSIDAVGNLYTRRAGSLPTASPLLTWNHLDSQLLMGSLTESTVCWRGLKKAMKHVRVTRRSPLKLVCWSNEEGSRFQLGCEGFAVSTGKRQLSESLTAQPRRHHDWGSLANRAAGHTRLGIGHARFPSKFAGGGKVQTRFFATARSASQEPPGRTPRGAGWSWPWTDSSERVLVGPLYAA
jgi:hypothetical protein